jgi:hypothetical protein
MDKARARIQSTSKGSTVLHTGGPTTLKEGEAALTADPWQLAGQAGDIHSRLVVDIRRLRGLSTADLTRNVNNNLKKLHELKALTNGELAQIQGIFQAAASKAPEQIKKLHGEIASQGKSASPLALTIADIAVKGVRDAGEKHFSWRAFFKDLAGAVGGGLGGAGGGPAGTVVGAVAGAVAASL